MYIYVYILVCYVKYLMFVFWAVHESFVTETQIGSKPINRCGLQVNCLVSMQCEIFHWGMFNIL